jgi:hypothetical protein
LTGAENPVITLICLGNLTFKAHKVSIFHCTLLRLQPNGKPFNGILGMGAGPVLSSLPQVRLVARLSQTGSAQKQADDWQVGLPNVKTGVQRVVLLITGR